MLVRLCQIDNLDVIVAVRLNYSLILPKWQFDKKWKMNFRKKLRKKLITYKQFLSKHANVKNYNGHKTEFGGWINQWGGSRWLVGR